MSIEEEKSYPRGGVSSLKKRKRVEDNGEETEIKDFPSKKKKDAQKEELFGTSRAIEIKGPESKKKRKRVSKKKSGVELAQEEEEEKDNEISRVGDLSYGSLSVGMKVLGVVYSVEQYQVKFSLPGYLVASLPITKISKIYNDRLVQLAQNASSADASVPQLEDMLPEGTVLPLTIASVDKSPEGKYRVKVSAEPELNILSLHHLCVGSRISGIISSIQDHGYTVDIGLKGVRAFLPLNKKQKAFSVGEIVNVTLTAKDEVANTASLSIKKKSVAETPSSIHSLIPGMRLNVAFKKKIKGGIMVSFGELEGVIPFPHYDMDEEFRVGQEMEAVVLYIAPIVNVVYLTTKSSIGTEIPANTNESVKAGELLNDCLVVSVTPKGLYLKKTIKKTKIYIFVSPFEAMDGVKNFKKLKETFPLNSKIKAVRLIQIDAITSVFIGSLKKDMIDIGIVSSKSLNVGDRVSAKIKSYTDKGVYVSLGRIQGFIRSIHLSNIPLNNPEVKYPVGSKLKCRVLSLPGMNKKKGITLTAKPMLVKSDRPIIDSFDSKFLNLETVGVVVQVNNHGLLLEFYGGTHGWVSKGEISSEPVEYPEKMFHIGQVLKCKVKKVDETKNRMLMTLILSKGVSESKKKKEETKKNKCKLSVGNKYSCKVTKIDANGLSIEVSTDESKPLTAFIPTNHLTDNICLANTLKKCYSVGDEIKEALFFTMDAVPVFTLKKSILTHDFSQINSFEDVHIGQIVPAVVKKVLKSGPSITFFVTKSTVRTETILLRNLSDFFIEDVHDLLSVQSTLLVKITDKNEENESLQLTSKLSAIPLNQEVELVQNLVDELKFIRKKFDGPLKKYEEGMVLSAKIVDKNSFGLFVSVDKDVQGVITNTNLEAEVEMDEASPMAVVVLFVDYENGVLELTNKVDIVSSITLRKEKPLHVDYHVQARPIWSRDDFHFILMMIESPHQFKGHLLKVSSRTSWNDWKGKYDDLSFDRQYRVQIKDRFESIAVFDDPKLSKSVEKNKKRKANKNVDETILKKIKVPHSKIIEEMTSSSVMKVENKSEKVIDADMEDEDFNPWGDGPLLKRGDEDKESDDKTKKKTHLSKSDAKALNKLEKEEIRRTEESIIRGEELEPKSKEDFEKLVLANPDSSLHWIQYIAFHADKGELTEARAVIKKAIEKINFREEDERLNIYIAWFNLENSVGSEDDVDALLKEILKYNNEFKVYSRVSLIYSQTDKLDKAEDMLKMMARKFSKEVEVWHKLGRHYFEKSKNLKEARFTLQRALQNLEKKHHVEITIKFAQMEFKYGEIERGKTIFETILSNYPKRIDIWNVYVDTLVKASEIQATRDLFERMITLNLQPKKMKSIFKKYIDFETSQNDEFKVDRIKKKALEYVESKVGALTMD